MLSLFTACTPIVQTSGPALDVEKIEADALIMDDGTRLPMTAWLPDQGSAPRAVRAVIIALHGFNDYRNAFAIPAPAWAARGIAVYAYDQRGFGGAPHRGIWPGVETLTADLRKVTRAIAARHPNTAIYWLGTSMGGAVVMAALAEPETAEGSAADAAAIAGAILVAPAVWGRSAMPLGHRVALWLGAHTLPWLKLSGRGLGITPSDNIEMLRALGRDPLVIKETRIDAIYGVVNLMDQALAAAAQITTPLLVLYGANDEIIPKAPTRKMIESFTGPHRVAVYEHGYHMLLRDLDARVVYDDIVAWIDDPTAPLPSGADKNIDRFLAD